MTTVSTTVGLLVGVSRSVDALVMPTTGFIIPLSAGHHARPSVRPTRATGEIKCSATSQGGGEAESADSSEIYSALRNRLQELRTQDDHGSHDGEGEGASPSLTGQEELERRAAASPRLHYPSVLSYSRQDMKKAYYQAFWRARNLKKVKGGVDSGVNQGDSSSSASYSNLSPPPRTSSSDMSPPTTLLSTLAMDMIISKYENQPAEAEDQPVETGAVQGFTQMYYLEEKDEEQLAVSGRRVAAAGVDVTASVERMWPVGLSQMFFLEDAHEEAEVAARALPSVYRSFLRERLGVPGEVVQDLRQVELDHARLAMLAVLLTGVVGAGAGAGVPASAELLDTNLGLAALAQVARTPWLDPCVAGVILAVKALSEGDWRIGKGALAGWADQGLCTISDISAKILRLGSGDEIRKLAVEMEVKHGRMALGAVVCAMAQQGLVAVGA